MTSKILLNPTKFLRSEEREEKVLAQFEYKGIAIRVGAVGYFDCKIDDERHSAPSLLELHNKIDKHLRAKTKLAKATPLSLAVTYIVCDGSKYDDKSKYVTAHGVITGIDRKSGELIITSSSGTKKVEDWEFVLVDTPEHRKLLADLADLRNRAVKLLRKAESRILRTRRGHHISSIDYGDHVEKLVKEYQQKTSEVARVSA